MPTIRADALTDFTAALLAATGSNPEEAETVARHLVAGNLRGHDSHGVGMMPQYVRNVQAGALRPNQRATLVQDSGAIAVFDGGMGYGQMIASAATADAIGRARTHGVGIYGLRNTHHVGRVGAYGEQALEAGLIFIAFVNVITPSARAAPHGGARGRYGTNPVCIAFPAAGGTEAVVLDFATTGLAAGKIRVAHNEGKQLPPGMLLDEHGNPTTNPGDFFASANASMLSFGAHKASGLALACELLAGALTGSGVIQQSALGKPAIRNGMLAILLDPARFGALDAIRAETEAIVAWVKSAPPAPGMDAVLVAGEPERIAMAERLANGIRIDAVTWKDLTDIAASLGVAAPTP